VDPLGVLEYIGGVVSTFECRSMMTDNPLKIEGGGGVVTGCGYGKVVSGEGDCLGIFAGRSPG
jgi:hypothetical protein